MRILNSVLPLLFCLGLFATVAGAEELAVPDKEQREGMSYEEYAKHREKMRQRMEDTHPDKRKQPQESSPPTAEKTDTPRQDSAYGQGYSARNREDKPDVSSRSRPERPEGRFSREGMGRR